MKRRNSHIVVAAAAIIVLMFGIHDRITCAASTGDAKAIKPAYYHYNPAGKPDPFKPFVAKEILPTKKSEKAAVVSIFPLQRAGIDQFNLVGIVGSAERRVAIVETKDGKGRYPVALGTRMGLNKGKVVEIRNDRIIIEEVIQGRTGQKINRISKKLRRDEEEGIP